MSDPLAIDDVADFPPRPRRPSWLASLRENARFGILSLLGTAAAAWLIHMLWPGEPRSQAELVRGLLLPGWFMALMFWLRRVMRYRVLLTSGEITGAVSTESGYSFHDLNGVHREASHRSDRPTGERLMIAYDPNDPRVHHPVKTADFVPS